MFDEVWLGEVGGKIAGFDARAASDGELCAAAVALTRFESLVAAGRAHVLAELDARKVTDRVWGMTTGSWLAREAGTSNGAAKRDVGTARKLRALPAVDAALREGRISAAHVRVVVDAYKPRIADAVEGLQEVFVDLAAKAPFERWRDEVGGMVTLVDEDGGYDPAEDPEANALSLALTVDGILYLTCQFVGEQALGVMEAIETKADELFRRFRADHQACPDLEIPERKVLRALALDELCHQAQAVDVKATRPARPEVTLIVRADEPDETTDANGVRLQDGSVRTLRCDPDLRPIVVDSLGVPLDLGRTVRLATTAQRRALAARDGAASFPAAPCQRTGATPTT